MEVVDEVRPDSTTPIIIILLKPVMRRKEMGLFLCCLCQPGGAIVFIVCFLFSRIVGAAAK